MKKTFLPAFLVTVSLMGIEKASADNQRISLSNAYLQCKAWLAVANKVRSGSYRFPNSQQALLSSIVPVCQNIQRIYVDHYKNLYDYQGYYNAILNNQGAPNMNAVLKAAYITERQKIKDSGQNVLPINPPSNVASPPAPIMPTLAPPPPPPMASPPPPVNWSY